MPAFCDGCGHKLKPSAEYCGQCGRQVDMSESLLANDSAAQPSPALYPAAIPNAEREGFWFENMIFKFKKTKLPRDKSKQ